MFNEFLSETLRVVLVLDLVGIVAYFVLSARRLRRRDPVTASPRIDRVHGRSLWRKLVRTQDEAMHVRPALAGSGPPSLDGALGQLRRVLDSYGSSLA